MYLTIRQYRTVTGSPEEIGRRVAEGLVPLLRRTPGFRSYRAAATPGGDRVFSVSAFDTREAASRANDLARAWVVEHLRDLLPDPADVMAGETFVEVTAAAEGDATPAGTLPTGQPHGLTTSRTEAQDDRRARDDMRSEGGGGSVGQTDASRQQGGPGSQREMEREKANRGGGSPA